MRFRLRIVCAEQCQARHKRHSFCTYRAAATKKVPQTALEAGDSVATIFSHYRSLATEAEGKSWFAIVPPHSVTNVVRLVRETKV